MKCDDAITEYCKLDRNKSLPFNAAMHLLFCPDCKRLITQMDKAQGLNSADPQQHINTSAVDRVMQKITTLEPAEPNQKNERLGFVLFLVAVVLLVLPFLLLPLLTGGQALIESLGVFFFLPIGLLCSLLVSTLCALFVIKNTRYFIKRFFKAND